MRFRMSLGVLGLLATHEVWAQNPEFRVNTYITGDQKSPAVAMGPYGNFVVVWESSSQDGSAWGVFAQRYDSAGEPQGPEFRVNTDTTSSQWRASAAMDDSGRVVVVWQNGNDGSHPRIFGQRFDADGSRLGAEFQINTMTGEHRDPDVAMDDEGRFVVVWLSPAAISAPSNRSRVHARRFEADGSPISSEFEVLMGSGRGYYDVYSPTVATSGGGSFVVAWRRSWYQDSVVVRHHASWGSECDRQIHEPVRLTFDPPDVAMARSGVSVVAYSDGHGGIRARRLQGCGPRGDEIVVNAGNTGSSPGVAFDASGNFIVTWKGFGDGSGAGIFARRFNGQGEDLGGEFLGNSYIENDQSGPVVAMNGAGKAVLAWQDVAQDGSGFGIYARLYEPSQWSTPAPTSTPTRPPGDRTGPIRPGSGAPLERTPRPIDRPTSGPGRR